MNYKFVYDDEQLRIFYETFVTQVCANVDRNNCSLKLFLQSRRKYNSQSQSKSTVVVLRKVIPLHQDAESFVRLVKRLQVERGLYTDIDKTNMQNVPLIDDSMVLYVTNNALCRVSATKNSLI